MEMNKPVIGVLGNSLNNTSGPVLIPATYANTAYCNAVVRNGGIPFIIPYLEDGEDLLKLMKLCDGILFPGGEDVDPHLYGEEPHASIGTINRKMDLFWIKAERFAEELGLPVLGICRGMQLINVARGGSLYQDLKELNPNHFLHTQKQNRDYLIHKVFIDPDSILAELFNINEILTNTLHHQCVENPGKDLHVTAYSADKIPEAMESKDRRIVLVQWHPEELVDSEPRMNLVFKNLVQEASRNKR